MSHLNQLQFVASVKARYPHMFCGRSVLEVGSMDVNGSNRPFFTDGSYLGIDICPGKGVDQVCYVWDVDGQFDVVLSTECLEHDPTWPRTVATMASKVRPGGLLLITCAGTGHGEHGTRKHPIAGMASDTDYYRNVDPHDILSQLVLSEWAEFSAARIKMDTQFFGIKA